MILSIELYLMALPLVTDRNHEDFLFRVVGEFQGTYLYEKLSDLWKSIPDSPSKNYVKNYCFFHLESPIIEECETADTEEAKQKMSKYFDYRRSRCCQEEQAAYLERLEEFRSKLHF